MEKRYQVFISSTFKDLEIERQEVMHALLELDCIPSGMELFPAANDSQWDLIQKVIDDCDYYILIIAGRYGSLGPDGLSYTEKEYRYALSINKPIISFIHKNPGKIISENTENSDEGKAKLINFRTLVEKKLCKHWEDARDLGSVVSRSLVQLKKSHPAVGWIRANELASPEAAIELLKLRQRIDELQLELSSARISPPRGAEELAQGDEHHHLRYSFVVTNSVSYQDSKWNSDVSVSWNEIFGTIAPLMINESSESGVWSALNAMIGEKDVAKLKRNPKFKDQYLAKFTLHVDDFQTIKIQLRALGLIASSRKARSVKDQGNYWTLTPYGDDIMNRLRAIRSDQEQEVAEGDIREGQE